MCGIAGIFAFSDDAPVVDREELRTVRDHMVARGPDGAGEWFSPCGRVALGHRRLSIIDLSELGTQPMASEDGRVRVTFNGEIYNFRELRAELERDGARFTSNSDTEVLLHLYARDGHDMASKLRGMFAFAIWDERRRGMFMARDPYGIKPLYYSIANGTLRFASQVRALLAGGHVSRRLDPAGQAGFYLWGYVPEPFTYYEEVASLGAGQSLWVDAHGPRTPRNVGSIAREWHAAVEQVNYDAVTVRRDRVHEALRESVRHHLVADVPVGIFLSGGIDSGALAGLMRAATASAVTGVTLQFEEFGGSVDDEVPIAQQIAARYGIDHHVRRVGKQEFIDDLPKILAAMDQPSIDGVNSWFVSKAMAERNRKVAVSGLGGDELFGGYGSFDIIPRIVRLGGLPGRVPGLGTLVRRASAPLVARAGFHPKLAGVLELSSNYENAYLLKRGVVLPWELPQLLPPEVVDEGLRKLNRAQGDRLGLPSNAYAAVASLEAERYMRNQLLRDVDWASMAHSVEVRVPLVDVSLLRAAAPNILAGGLGAGKRVLAEAPQPALPDELLTRSKTGFTTPVAAWMSESAQLSAWRRVPLLCQARTPWARRFAYSVASSFASM